MLSKNFRNFYTYFLFYNIIGKKYLQYNETYLNIINEPLKKIKREKYYDIIVVVKGGGLTGQVGAMVHGISKALLMFDTELKSTLKKEKLTTRDSRSVERKKYGHRKARRSFQFSKR